MSDPATATPASARVLRVAVPKPLHGLFDYSLPTGLPVPPVGARVRVPFGKQHLIGLCISHDPSDAHTSLKAVEAVLDDENVLGEDLLRLALWTAGYYHHPIGEVLAAVLPVEARKGAALTIERAEAWRVVSENGVDATLKHAPRQRTLLEFLTRAGGSATLEALRGEGFDRRAIRNLAGKGLITRTESREIAPVPAASPAQQLPILNAEQRQALGACQHNGSQYHATLLDGVTGSGKTEVYLRLIDHVLRNGAQVLVLVPEIALTPQTLSRFVERFGQAETLHSNLNDRQRLQTWLRCRSGDAGILIGTRSAIFTPFKNLGLIVVDEEHDASFKQQDGLRYSARDLAVKRAQELDIPLLLGSATPSFESLHNASIGRYQHLKLLKRAGGAQLPRFELLDIRGQPQTDGVSEGLARIIGRHLEARGQVLVFINRRGFAPGLLCARCGWLAQCDRCDCRLTLHRQPAVLLCHHCNRRQNPPTQCPSCGHSTLIAVGAGTQRVAAGLLERFPDVPQHRIDRDTTRSQPRLEAKLAAIQEGSPALLIGTQMLAKGHHFPAVTLVAVLNADSGFLSPDFRAPERTAQLIIQVAGRAGRAERPGVVCVQTYQPDNPLLRALVADGYAGFASREIETRRAAGLPPFRPMALVRAEARDGALAQRFLVDVSQRLTGDVEILGPVPAPMARVADRQRFQLLLLADHRRQLHGCLSGLEQSLGNGQLKCPNGVRFSLDVDPYDTF